MKCIHKHKIDAFYAYSSLFLPTLQISLCAAVLKTGSELTFPLFSEFLMRCFEQKLGEQQNEVYI